MKKVITLLSLTVFILGAISCSAPEVTITEPDLTDNNRNARTGCELCIDPFAEITSISNGSNCSNIVNFRVFPGDMMGPIPLRVEKSSDGTNWVAIKFFSASDYTIGSMGFGYLSFTDLNPYQPSGGVSPNSMYYRIKIYPASGPPAYSLIDSKVNQLGCTGLPNTVFGLSCGTAVHASGGDFDIFWNEPNPSATGPFTQSVFYLVKQKNSIIGSGTVSPAYSPLIISTTPVNYIDPARVSWTVTVNYSTGETESISCFESVPMNY